MKIGGTPLHYACAALKDSTKCVELLVFRGAKINVQDHKKNTPIMVASFYNKPKITNFLVNAGADLRIKNSEDKDAYDVAEEKDHYETKEILLKQMEKMGIKKEAMTISSSFSDDSGRAEDDINKNIFAI